MCIVCCVLLIINCMKLQWQTTWLEKCEELHISMSKLHNGLILNIKIVILHSEIIQNVLFSLLAVKMLIILCLLAIWWLLSLIKACILIIWQPKYAHGLGSLQFPNGSSPVVSRMCLYTGSSMVDTKYVNFLLEKYTW